MVLKKRAYKKERAAFYRLVPRFENEEMPCMGLFKKDLGSMGGGHVWWWSWATTRGGLYQRRPKLLWTVNEMERYIEVKRIESPICLILQVKRLLKQF